MNSDMLNWVIPVDESGRKLQPFLKNKLGERFSARQIKQLIDTGNCQINGKVERFSSRHIGTGDRIVFHVPKKATLTPCLATFYSPDRVLYADDEFIIYDKPAGFSSDDPRLLSFIRQFDLQAKSAACPTQSPNAQLAHRLDRETTGALIFSRNTIAGEAIFNLFKLRQIKKTYLAIVDGIPESSHGTIENFLGKLAVYQGQTLYGEISQGKGGLRARTIWRRKKSGQECSLIICHPETGRTHQLRVHLSGLGHPILGDYQYGRSFTCPYRPQRILLHAYEINFKNPITNKLIQIISKPPSDFEEAHQLLIDHQSVSISSGLG